MSDPYSSNPYQSSPAVSEPVRQVPATGPDAIAALQISETWKNRFRLIEAAGGPTLPKFKQLPSGERMKIQFNILAFLLGPFYYLAKGLWRQAVLYLILAIACAVLFELLGLGKFARAVGYGFAAVYALRANVSYYKRVVLGEPPWL
ncbi:MAG: DUF2628 domain-containing protein [Stenotrophomonas sp.]